MKTLLCAILLLAGMNLQALTKDSLREAQSSSILSSEKDPLYLPDVRYTKLITLGFDSFVSDVLWFHTVNYFGKQYMGAKNYKWFYEMCKLVTNLDPKKSHVFQFCGTLLSWEAKDVEASNEILSDAITANPNDWNFYYLRGFNYWYFLERKDLASKDFVKASKLPEAPPFLASIASRLLVDEESPQDAVNFLLSVLKNSDDPHAREAIEEKLKSAILTRDLWLIRNAIARYEAKFKEKPTDLEALISGGILVRLPPEPYGGSYILNKESGEVSSTSGQQELKFRGKTLKTSNIGNKG